MPKIYLSCSRMDAALARRLAEALRARGLDVWWVEDLEAGPVGFSDQVKRELGDAAAVVALWTPNAVTSEWVGREAGFAQEHGKLVNVVLGDIELPPAFRGQSAIELDGAAANLDLAPLVAAIERRLAGADAQDAGALTSAPEPPVVASGGVALADAAVLTRPLSERDLGLLSYRRTPSPAPFADDVARHSDASAPTAPTYSPSVGAAPMPPPPSVSSASSHAPMASSPPPRTSGGAGCRPVLLAAGGIGAIIVAGALFGREIAAIAAAAAKMLHLSALSLPTGAAAASAIDDVDVSVFAPPGARPGDQLLVQVFLHTLEEEATAAAFASAADPTTARKGAAALDVQLERGARLDICIDAPGVEIEEPVQSFVWRGRAQSVQFLVAIPKAQADGLVQFRIRVLLASIPIGQVRFALPIEADGAPRGLGLVGESATRFTRAFLSYAHEDRVEVLKRAQALRAARIGFFQDLLSIEPGEAWRGRLEGEIDECDLFLLFWSEAARGSEWVDWEINRAIERQGRTGNHTPEIMPVMLEGPPPPGPPPQLKHLHFDDVISYLIAAHDR